MNNYALRWSVTLVKTCTVCFEYKCENKKTCYSFLDKQKKKAKKNKQEHGFNFFFFIAVAVYTTI